MSDIVTACKLVTPYHLRNHELYGKLIQRSVLLSVLFLVMTVLIFNKFFTTNLVILIIIFLIIVLISSIRMFFAMTILFPFLMGLLFIIIPMEFEPYFGLAFLWFCYVLAILFWSKEVTLTGLPLVSFVGSTLLLIIATTIIFKSPYIINLLIYQDVLINVMGDHIYLIYNIIFLFCPILFIVVYRKFDINVSLNKKGNNGFSYIFDCFFLFLNLLASIPPIGVIWIKKLSKPENETSKYFSDSFIDENSANYFFEYLKNRYDYQFEHKNVLLTDVIIINKENVFTYSLAIDNLFWSAYCFMEGNEKILNTISQYLNNDGSILLKKCYSNFSKNKEHQIFLMYKDIIQCKSLKDIETFKNQIVEIESESSELYHVEKKFISTKISYLKKELLVTECLCIFEQFLSKNELYDNNLSMYELNIRNNINYLIQKIVENGDIRILDENIINDLVSIKKSIEFI